MDTDIRGKVAIVGIGHTAARWASAGCFGTKIHGSSYGVEGDDANGTAFQGMGRLGTKITATKGSGVMYVEIAYSYRPIIGVAPISLNDIVEVAAYNIWEMRDLSQVYSSPGVAASTCS